MNMEFSLENNLVRLLLKLQTGEKTKSKPEIIRLRERGTKKVHVFKAWKQTVKAPEKRPEWMPEKISKPFVKKEKIETIE
jgi:hypothetical protein